MTEPRAIATPPPPAITVAILGARPEVLAAVGDLGVRGEPHDSASVNDRLISAAIVDLRAIRLDRAIELRQSAPLARVPALVLSDRRMNEEVYVALGAIEVVHLPVSDRALRRTLGWFVELATGRLAPPRREEDDPHAAERRRYEHIAALATLAGGLAHEIRNPLAVIRSVTEQLAEDASTADPHSRHLTHILQAVERVEQVVSVSLRLAVPSDPRLGVHQPWAIVARAVTDARTRLSERAAIDLQVEVEAELSSVLCDAIQLAHAIGELIDNAAQACPVPTILVRAGAVRGEADAPRSVHFTVRDEGPGMDDATQARVFDPFFTTSPTKTGLGLSIAQQIILRNGGHIEVASRAGGPTSFTIVMAAIDGDAQRERRDDPS